MSIIFLLFVIIAGAFVLLLPVLIAIYVYEDAKSRNMHAVLWTLLVLLLPGFIGLLIYLLVRSNNTNQSYGMSLKDSCPSCAMLVDSTWKLCPICGTELPIQRVATVRHTVPKKDRWLKRIIIAVAAISVWLLAIAMVTGGSFSISSSMGMGTGFALELDNVSNDVADWVNQCDTKGKGVYVLKLLPERADQIAGSVSGISGASKDIYNVYIYINQYKGASLGKGFLGDATVNGKTLEVSYNTTDTSGEKLPDYELSDISTSGYNINKLVILIDGDEVKYSLNELK